MRAAEQDRPDVAHERCRWRSWQRFMDPARFVFLDETGAVTNMARRYGRGPSDERLVAAVPHGHWHTTTFVAGLRQTGVVAPLVLDGPMTGPAFRAYIKQFLAPSLEPGDVVVLDNLAAHKGDGVRQAIKAAGAHLLYLPPYSPDLNPIEQLFAKLKALLRKGAARTKEALWATIGDLLDHCPPTECRNYLSHCGYASTYLKNSLVVCVVGSEIPPCRQIRSEPAAEVVVTANSSMIGSSVEQRRASASRHVFPVPMAATSIRRVRCWRTRATSRTARWDDRSRL